MVLLDPTPFIQNRTIEQGGAMVKLELLFQEFDVWISCIVGSIQGEPSSLKYVVTALQHFWMKSHGSAFSLPVQRRGPRNATVIKLTELTIVSQAPYFWRRVFGSMNKSLNKIDRSVANDMHVTQLIGNWRHLLGIWRSLLPMMNDELEENTKVITRRSKDLCNYSSDLQEILDAYGELLNMCKMLQERVERTSQALMATMSIMESQNAIKQGHQIQRLTELAFIFIPMSFASSYFGMEVQVSELSAGTNMGSVY